MAELVKICDPAGRTRGSGFVADDRGTVVTSHEAVAGLTRVVLHAPGPAGRTWLAGAADVTALPGLALALVRTDGLGMRPLPVALREVIAPGTYVRLPARGWRQARVLGGAEVSYPAADRSHAVPAGVVVELAIGTDGRDALLLGGEACGGPVLDARTGAVLAVVGTALRAEHRSGGFAVALRAAADADPDGPLAALLERNAATVPGHGADLNLAGALELTATTLGASFPPDEPEPVERPGIAAELAAFTTGDHPVLGLVGDPGTGRTTALAALAERRARGACPAPTLWLRGADLRATDTSLSDAATRALTEAARIVGAAGPTACAGAESAPQPPPHGADGSSSAGAGCVPGTFSQADAGPRPGSAGDGCVSGRSPQGAERTAAASPDPSPRSAPEETPRRSPGPGGTPPDARRSQPAPGPGGTGPGGTGSGGAAPAERRSQPAPAGAPRIAEHLAHVVARAGRRLLVVLDAPEEMPPELAHRLGPWTTATAGWLHTTGTRLVVAARPEYWEGAGALYPPGALHTPARPARRLPPALPLADLDAAEAETARARLGIPADAVREADARHPLTLHLLAGIRAAEVTAGRPGRDEVFAAHLDLLCLRTAVRIAAACADAGGAKVHGPGVRRLAARVAGRVHEAARRALGPGQGQLDRASFEELFPWRTGWASAVLTEGLLVPAGPGYRFAHEELSDWIQAGHLDVPTALGLLVHGPAEPGLPVPRHRIGPVLEALRRLAPDRLRGELTGLVHRLNRFTEEPERATADSAWWAARLLRETLLRAPDARPHLPVLHALAEHVARAGPGEFGGWFWNRLRLPEPDRLDLLRRLLPADPAEAVPGDRYLDAAARRLARDPQRAQPLLCAWFTDGRRLRGRPGATVATAAQALLHTHRSLAVDDLTEALVTAAHPRADELLAVLAEEEPSALCRAVDRWAHDERPGRRVAAAAYGLATAPHVRTPADRELLRYAAQALLARPADATLHGSALAILLRDPQVRGRYLPDALACFRDPEFGSRLPAAALVAALPVLPDPDEVFAALRARADGEVVRALAALTTPGLARRAAELVREHLARSPGDAPHAAFFVDRRLDQGPAAASVVRPLVLGLLRGAPAWVRAELAAVLAAPGGAASYPLRGELADTLLREEADPGVLDAFLGALAAKAAGRAEDRTRELLRRTGRQLLRAPGGAAVFERRTVELARAEPAFGALVARWLATAEAEAAALLGPSARRTVETLSRAAADVT
ncbi:serine protease [Streptomyces sp. NRRL S-448]|uniref:serine protease n=1 Tax=Streptomyces sp. NRRL S-448 TaxID=1463907 RepID=UPI0035674593